MVLFYLFVRLVGSVILEPHTFFRGDFGRILNRVLDNWMGVMGIVVVVGVDEIISTAEL